MKFSFFKTKSNVSKFSETTNLEEKILSNLEQIVPFPSAHVTIHYVFTCTHGRNGVNFAAKLAEDGEEVKYSHAEDGSYNISGKSASFPPNKQQLKQHFLTLAEKGSKYNCVLTEWRFS